MIHFECPHCGFKLKINPQSAGKKGRCPKCNHSVQAPDSEADNLNSIISAAPDHRPPPTKKDNPAIPQPAKDDPQPPSRARLKTKSTVTLAGVLLTGIACGVFWLSRAPENETMLTENSPNGPETDLGTNKTTASTESRQARTPIQPAKVNEQPGGKVVESANTARTEKPALSAEQQEYFNAAALASQPYKIGKDIIKKGDHKTYEKLKTSSNQSIVKSTESAWEAIHLYEAAIKARKIALEKSDQAMADFAEGMGYAISSNGPVYTLGDLRIQGENRRYANQLTADAIKNYVQSHGAGIGAEKLFQLSTKLQQQSWRELLSLIRQNSQKKTPAGNKLLDFEIVILKRRDYESMGQLFQDLFVKTDRRLYALKATNQSKHDLHNVTLDLNLKAISPSVKDVSPAGPLKRRLDAEGNEFYFIQRWPAGETIELVTGVNWPSTALRKTYASTWSLWSEKYHLNNRSHSFKDNLFRLAIEELDGAEKSLTQSGNYHRAIRTANNILTAMVNHLDAPALKKRAERLLAEARQMKENHELLLSAIKPGTKHSGRWIFGKYSKPLDIIFQQKKSSRNVKVFVDLMDPEKSPQYHGLAGNIVFSSELKQWAVIANGNYDRVMYGTPGSPVRPGDDLTKEPSLSNLLARQDNRKFVFVGKNGQLHAYTSLGDELELIQTKQADAEKRITALINSPIPKPEILSRHEIKPVPQELFPKSVDLPLYQLEHTEGEIRRIYAYVTGRVTATGHRVNMVVFNQLKPQLMTQRSEYENNIWDLKTGKLLSQFQTNSNGSVAASADLKIVANGHRRYVLLKDSSTDQELKKIDVPSGAVAFGGPIKNQLLLSGESGGSGDFYAWNSKGVELVNSTLQQNITAVAVSPDGSLVFAASSDNKINIWDVKTGKFVKSFEDLEYPVLKMICSPDNRFVFNIEEHIKKIPAGLGSRKLKKFQLRIWDMQDLKTRHVDIVGIEPQAIAVSPDWKRLLIGENTGQLYLWDLKTGKPIRRFVGHQSSGSHSYISSVAFSPDGRFAVSGGKDLWAILWGLP